MENYFDDGAYLITKLLIKMAQLKKENRTLFSLIDSSRSLRRVRVACMNIPRAGVAPAAAASSKTCRPCRQRGWDVAKENYEGLRCSFGAGEGDGWFLLRMSLHDPLMPLNIESNSAGGVHQIAESWLGS
ncbi:MAG: hypothetical protein R2912_07180 [Eubacteriales bacterium]